MSNDLSTFFEGGIANLPTKNAAAALRATSLDKDSSNRFVESLEGRELLKFASRVQKWVFGKDEEPLGDDRIAVNPGSFVHGMCCWTGGNNSTFVDEIMVPITEPLPTPKPDWAGQGDITKQFQVDLQPIEGEYDGVPLRFRSNSYGGVTSVQDLAGKLADRLEAEHENFFVPVVVLDHTTYNHKTWGTLGNPVFKIVDWMNTDGLLYSERPGAADEETATKKKGRLAGPAAAAKEEPANKETPARATTRRRAS